MHWRRRRTSVKGSAVQVRLFADGIEIESPGNLPAWVTVENLRDAQYSRNPRIMDAFHVLRLVEEAGSGIDKMYMAMEDALLEPPQFEEKSNAFVVRFRGRSVFAAEDRIWISQFASFELPAEAKVALVYARRNGAVTNAELRALRHLDSGASRGVLQELVVRGLLRPIGERRGTRYVLTEVALRARRRANLDEQVEAIAVHARRTGSIVNRDVRGLLGVNAEAARTLLEAAVSLGLLEPIGERRGRRYLPRH